MTFTLRWTTGSEQTLDVDSQICTRKGEIVGTLPYAGPMDCFDYISDSVNTWVLANLPTMTTRFGTLFLNSIQLSERFYAQHYEFSASYGTINKQTGTYQITVDQAVGNEQVAAGELIACYPAASAPADETGSFHDGREQKSFPVPVEEDRITVSYRHPKAYLNAAYIRAVGRLRGKLGAAGKQIETVVGLVTGLSRPTRLVLELRPALLLQDVELDRNRSARALDAVPILVVHFLHDFAIALLTHFPA